METWKRIDWIDGISPIYEVSNYGAVRTDKCIKKAQTDKDGYKRVMLYGQKPFKKYVPVHRLVAIAFVPNPNNYDQVNHKDENKTNNAVDNLEWCDCKYNNNYGNRNSRISRAKTGTKRPYMVRNEKGQYAGSNYKTVEKGANNNDV